MGVSLMNGWWMICLGGTHDVYIYIHVCTHVHIYIYRSVMEIPINKITDMFLLTWGMAQCCHQIKTTEIMGRGSFASWPTIGASLQLVSWIWNIVCFRNEGSNMAKSHAISIYGLKNHSAKHQVFSTRTLLGPSWKMLPWLRWWQEELAEARAKCLEEVYFYGNIVTMLGFRKWS